VWRHERLGHTEGTSLCLMEERRAKQVTRWIVPGELSGIHRQELTKLLLWQVGDYVTRIRMASYNRVTVVTLVVSYLVKKFPVCYVTRMFITVFRRERHWMVSWASWLQSTSLQPSSLTSIMAVSCYSIQSSPSISCVLHVPRNSLIILGDEWTMEHEALISL
jgi:hypothetical protein